MKSEVFSRHLLKINKAVRKQGFKAVKSLERSKRQTSTEKTGQRVKARTLWGPS